MKFTSEKEKQEYINYLNNLIVDEQELVNAYKKLDTLSNQIIQAQSYIQFVLEKTKKANAKLYQEIDELNQIQVNKKIVK